MSEPRIVTTKITRGPDAESSRASAPASTSPRAREPGPGTGSFAGDEPPRARRRGLHPVLFGLLFVAGGFAVWGATRGERTDVPDVWNETTGPDGPSAHMVAQVKPSGPAKLLRLEWPAHPQAEGYRIRFLDERGLGPAAVPVQSTVFLYDMQTNVLHLPSSFEWVVTAVLPDGSEIVTPTRRYPE